MKRGCISADMVVYIITKLCNFTPPLKPRRAGKTCICPNAPLLFQITFFCLAKIGGFCRFSSSTEQFLNNKPLLYTYARTPSVWLNIYCTITCFIITVELLCISLFICLALIGLLYTGVAVWYNGLGAGLVI